MRAWRGRGACRTPEAPLPWCLQITRNEALRLIGRSQRRQAAEAPELPYEVADERIPPDGDRAVDRIDVSRALAHLPVSERALIELRYTHDCSHPEIAQALDISEAAARVRLHRAHKRLKTLLADR